MIHFRPSVVIVVAALLFAALAWSPIAAAPVDDGGGVEPAQLTLWTQTGYVVVAKALHEYFLSTSNITRVPIRSAAVSIPPDTAEGKLRPYGREVTRRVTHQSTAAHRIAAQAEFHFPSWSMWMQHHGYALNATWADAGCTFRADMADAGYSLRDGDGWEINEAPHTIRTNASFRQFFMTEVVQGLVDGCTAGRYLANLSMMGAIAGQEKADASATGTCESRGLPVEACVPVRGTLYLAGMGMCQRDLALYKANLKSMLRDDRFWHMVDATLVAFSPEVYTDPACTCEGVMSATRQLAAVRMYTQHVMLFAVAGGNESAVARRVLQSTYTPLMGGVFDCPKRDGYGATTIQQPEFEAFLALQLQSVTALGDSVNGIPRRPSFGFGSCDRSNFNTTIDAADALIGALRRVEQQREPSACVVPDAKLSDAWSTFQHW